MARTNNRRGNRSNRKIYKTYRKGQVVYADLGKRSPGVQAGLRPCVVVSRNESNHKYAPQITVCPLSTKLKYKKIHVHLKPFDVSGRHLKKESELLPEDVQTIPKSAVRWCVGYVNKKKMLEIDRVLVTQLGLLELMMSA